jgi:uncharacterized protein (TIGR03435 family)
MNPVQHAMKLALVILAGVSGLAAADLSGHWSGSFYGGPIYLILKQDSNRLAGSGGASEGQQAFPLAGASIDGSHIQFKMGPVAFDLQSKGDDLEGQMTIGPDTIPITLTRVEVLARRKPAAARFAFDAGSVKLNTSGAGDPNSGRGGSIRPSKGRLAMENASLWKAIAFAYGIAEDKDYALSTPAWMKTARFDINATFPADTRWEQLQAMTQDLLAQRFHLKTHRESKEMTVYALVVSRTGSKLQAVEPGPSRFNMARGKISALNAPLASLADRLSQFVDRPVIDMTGLKGAFTFTLEWTPDESPDAGASIFSAIQEQLGLKLEARKAPIGVLVVDSADRLPTEN